LNYSFQLENITEITNTITPKTPNPIEITGSQSRGNLKKRNRKDRQSKHVANHNDNFPISKRNEAISCFLAARLKGALSLKDYSAPLRKSSTDFLHGDRFTEDFTEPLFRFCEVPVTQGFRKRRDFLCENSSPVGNGGVLN
jgi:hypothetical protein